jgi:ribonucleotide reductase beta subunit family protein with ferritin-like domain
MAESQKSGKYGKRKTTRPGDSEEGFDVTIKKSESYSLDQDAYKNIRLDIPEEIRPEKIKLELDKKGYEWLKENNQDIYKKVSDCVTFKIGKSTINIEKVK